MTKPRALIIKGDGINCERETAWAFELAGFEPNTIHVTDVLAAPQSLQQYKMICIPGGFAFGDEIASGKVLAIKLKEKLQDSLQAFVDQKKLLLGICNGFQVLVQMGILPLSQAGASRLVSLAQNEKGKFINRWVTLEIDRKPASDIFYRGLSRIDLPIRHGEGRIKLGHDTHVQNTKDLSKNECNRYDSEMRLEGVSAECSSSSGAGDNAIESPAVKNGKQASEVVRAHAAMRYEENVNGSYDRIASLINDTGTVMGLMPHPEAFVRYTQHPQWTNKAWRKARFGSDKLDVAADLPPCAALPDGLAILRNACEYIKSA